MPLRLKRKDLLYFCQLIPKSHASLARDLLHISPETISRNLRYADDEFIGRDLSSKVLWQLYSLRNDFEFGDYFYKFQNTQELEKLSGSNGRPLSRGEYRELLSRSGVSLTEFSKVLGVDSSLLSALAKKSRYRENPVPELWKQALLRRLIDRSKDPAFRKLYLLYDHFRQGADILNCARCCSVDEVLDQTGKLTD
ncbi:MAG TPA: hypothetical protein DCR21_02610 [Succinivibrionaceae bacterium]|nr:hypothetical protein [Succinivibrionaceae bacterium]